MNMIQEIEPTEKEMDLFDKIKSDLRKLLGDTCAKYMAESLASGVQPNILFSAMSSELTDLIIRHLAFTENCYKKQNVPIEKERIVEAICDQIKDGAKFTTQYAEKINKIIKKEVESTLH
jgi:hypothetical protein